MKYQSAPTRFLAHFEKAAPSSRTDRIFIRPPSRIDRKGAKRVAVCTDMEMQVDPKAIVPNARKQVPLASWDAPLARPRIKSILHSCDSIPSGALCEYRTHHEFQGGHGI